MEDINKITQTFKLSLEKSGIDESVFGQEKSKLQSLIDKINTAKLSGSMPFLTLPMSSADLEEIEFIAEKFRNKFERLIVFGVGGSSLGARALVESSDIYSSHKSPIFVDASDPLTFEMALRGCPLEKTGFLVISKSGSTLETTMQMLLILSDAPVDNFIFISAPGDNPLRRVAREYNIKVIDHDPNLVGRFSVMSPVGLIPAAYAGIDIRAVRRGAQNILNRFFDIETAEDNTPFFAAAASVVLARFGININVMMPYIDRLKTFTLWHRQLWAESLGKDGLGMTPLVASGSADQHSQLQLYLDGPRDKLFTIICMDSSDKKFNVSNNLAQVAGMPWLADKGMASLNNAMAEATIEALISQGMPVRKILLSGLDDYLIGELMMHYMLETVIAAEMLGVNAFNQPAVERVKVTSARNMGRVLK